MIFVQIEKIVDFLGIFTICHVAAEIDPSIRDLRLHGDVDAIHPPAPVDGRRDVIELDILLGHLLFIKNHSSSPPRVKNDWIKSVYHERQTLVSEK